MPSMRGVVLRNSAFGGFSWKQKAPQNHFLTVVAKVATLSRLEVLVGYQAHKNNRIYSGYGRGYFSESGSAYDMQPTAGFMAPCWGYSFLRWGAPPGMSLRL
jgi:hypothetical protein